MLPGGFEPVLQLRTYYFDQESLTGSPSAAWALGGWAGLRSPWWGDLFQVGIVGYTSQKLYGPDDKDGTKLLQPGQDPINVLGEAFGAVRVAWPDVHRLPAAHQSAVHQSAGQPDGAQHVRGLHVDRGRGRCSRTPAATSPR